MSSRSKIETHIDFFFQVYAEIFIDSQMYALVEAVQVRNEYRLKCFLK